MEAVALRVGRTRERVRQVLRAHGYDYFSQEARRRKNPLVSWNCALCGTLVERPLRALTERCYPHLCASCAIKQRWPNRHGGASTVLVTCLDCKQDRLVTYTNLERMKTSRCFECWKSADRPWVRRPKPHLHHPRYEWVCSGCGEVRFYRAKELPRKKTDLCQKCIRGRHRRGISI